MTRELLPANLSYLREQRLPDQPDRHVYRIRQGGGPWLHLPGTNLRQAPGERAEAGSGQDHHECGALVPAQLGPSESCKQRRDIALGRAPISDRKLYEHIRGSSPSRRDRLGCGFGPCRRGCTYALGRSRLVSSRLDGRRDARRRDRPRNPACAGLCFVVLSFLTFAAGGSAVPHSSPSRR